VLLVEIATLSPTPSEMEQFSRPVRLVATTDRVLTPGLSTTVLDHGSDTLKSVCGAPDASV
jgi:hypothetical protein